MDAESIARRWFLAALPYFLASVGIGVYMGASGDHSLFTLHSHLGLLGWAAMGLTGVLYRAFPAAATSKLAAWHFILYQVAVPIMLIAVTALIFGNKSAEPVAGMASIVILVSVVLFCWNIVSARRSV